MVFSQEQLTFLILLGLAASQFEPESFNEMKTDARYLQLKKLSENAVVSCSNDEIKLWAAISATLPDGEKS